MRRVMLALVCAWLTLGALGAFELGIKGGSAAFRLSDPYAFTHYSVTLETRSHWGALAGLMARWQFTPQLGVQAELLWQQRGSHSAFEFMVDEHPIRLAWSTAMDYLVLPVLLRVALPQWGPVRSAVFVGGSIGWRLNGTLTLGMGGDQWQLAAADMLKDSIRRLDAGAIVGVGVDFPLKGVVLNADGRYYHGLANIAAPTDDNGPLHHRGFELSAGVLLPL